MSTFPYKRIVVIGATSSGKSTLAERIAKRFNMNFIELDALHWEPNWVEAPLEVFRERVRIAAQAPAWIVAGNYHVVRDLVWQKAENMRIVCDDFLPAWNYRAIPNPIVI